MRFYDLLKKIALYIIVGVFWIALAFTFVGGVFGTCFASTDEEEDYEEYIQSTIP